VPIEVNKLATNKLDYQIMRNINEKVDVITSRELKHK
jgi:hypothetical protein